MNSSPTSTVGLLSDPDPYLKDLINQIGPRVVALDPEPGKYVSNGFPSELEVQGAQITSIILNAHIGQGVRQYLIGVDWLRKFRMLGFTTPAVVFAWNSIVRIRSLKLLSNPFVGAYSKESCSLIRLPVEISSLKDALLRLRPIDSRHWHEGRRWATRAALNHELVRIARADCFNYAKTLLEQIPTNMEYAEYSADLNFLRQLTTLDELRIAIGRFVQESS